jgi:DNA-binding transcriptional MerR regulator
MANLISIEDLIKEAEKSGVDFGKGDPYNRLRYYTKIGWLPHMERKEGKGHFPSWALERLVFIESLKSQGLSNEEISKRINSKDKVQAIGTFLKSPETKTKAITYASFIVLLLILSSELGLLPLGKPKGLILNQYGQTAPSQIIQSGTSFVPENKKEVFVKTNSVLETHKIYLTFNDNIIPAARFWVGKKVPFEGFYVELDAPLSKNVEFSWWISN